MPDDIEMVCFPTTITALGDGMSGVILYLPNPSRLAIDIQVITNQVAPGDPVVDYSLRVFSANGTSPGHARFQYDPDGVRLTAPTGINWGGQYLGPWGRGDR